MKKNVKKILLGIFTVVICLFQALGTFGIIVAYRESFRAVGIIAILMFIYATIGLAMILYSYWIIGDSIMYIREKNMKKNENTDT